MRHGNTLVAVMIISASMPCNAIQLLKSIPGGNGSPPQLAQQDIVPLRAYDVDDDGDYEICYTKGSGDGLVFFADRLVGVPAWQYALTRASICPTCNPATWSWQFHGFGQLDPTPGKEAVFSWYDYTSKGVTVVSTSLGTVLLNRPSAHFEDIIDLENGGQSDNLVMAVGEGGPGDPSIEIWGNPTASDVAPLHGDGLARIRTVPNPASDRVQVSFDVTKQATATITIYDAGGRVVRELPRSAVSPNVPIGWDTLDNGRHPVAAGVYFVRAVIDGQVLQSRVTVAR